MYSCKICGKEFEKKQQLGGHVLCAHKNNSINKRYFDGSYIYKKITKVCPFCGEEFETATNKKEKTFCSVSCSNNSRERKKTEKEKKKRFCSTCGNELSEKNCRKVCSYCLILMQKKRTKKDLFMTRKNWQSARSSIRKNAHDVYFKYNRKENKCKICGYDKHIEIAHIKAVSLFEESATIAEINAIDNLIALCPNHHWEFDNNLLNVKI